jgi:aspartate/glutamate racemase
MLESALHNQNWQGSVRLYLFRSYVEVKVGIQGILTSCNTALRSCCALQQDSTLPIIHFIIHAFHVAVDPSAGLGLRRERPNDAAI